MAIKTKVIKKTAARIAKKAVRSGRDMAADAIDNAKPAVKALKKATVRKAKELRKAAAPKVKQLRKAAAPRIKAMKKAAARTAVKVKEQAREITKDALTAGSAGLKKAAKAL